MADNEQRKMKWLQATETVLKASLSNAQAGFSTDTGKLILKKADGSGFLELQGAGGSSLVTALDDLTDVDTTGKAGYDALMWDSAAGKWVPFKWSLYHLNDVDLTGLTSGKFLSWNGTAWVPTTNIINGTYTQIPRFNSGGNGLEPSTMTCDTYGNVYISGDFVMNNANPRSIFMKSLDGNTRLALGYNNSTTLHIGFWTPVSPSPIRISGKIGVNIAPDTVHDMLIDGRARISGNTGMGVDSDTTHKLKVTGLCFLNGNVGIGVAAHGTYPLDVLGDTRLQGDIIWPTVVSGDTDKKIIAKTTNLGDLNVLYIWEDSGEVTQLNMHVGDDGMSYVYIKGAEAEVSGNLTVIGTGYFGELATFFSGITGNGITNNGDIDSATSGTTATLANLVVTESTTIPSAVGGFYEEGSFTATWDGGLGTFTIYFTRVGNQVNLSGNYTGTCAGSETFTTDAIPTSLRPTRIQHFVAQMEAATYTPKSGYIATSGKMYFNVSNIAATPSQTTTACNISVRNIVFNATYNLN